jgi:16S rRNA G527 N7-methylase RsmG
MIQSLVPFLIALLIVAVVCLGFLFLLSRSKSKQRQVLKRRIEELDAARNLLSSQHYDVAVIKAYSSLELAFKYTAQTYRDLPQFNSSFELITYLQSKGKFTKDQLNQIHQIRMLRNRAVHDKQPISAFQAQQAIANTVTILSDLGFAV